MSGHAVSSHAVTKRLAMLLVVPGALALGTACGESVRTRVAKAMDGCVQARNDAFKRGDGEAALAIPLPKAVDSLANETAYTFGLIVYQETSDNAQTQAELTCALELGSRFDSQDTRDWLTYYSRHPNAPVASLAARQLAKLKALNGEPGVLAAPAAASPAAASPPAPAATTPSPVPSR